MRPEGGIASDALVVEVARRGKLLVGEPYFTPGVPVMIDRKGSGEAGPARAFSFYLFLWLFALSRRSDGWSEWG